jgi:hypothetical protein
VDSSAPVLVRGSVSHSHCGEDCVLSFPLVFQSVLLRDFGPSFILPGRSCFCPGVFKFSPTILYHIASVKSRKIFRQFEHLFGVKFWIVSNFKARPPTSSFGPCQIFTYQLQTSYISYKPAVKFFIVQQLQKLRFHHVAAR